MWRVLAPRPRVGGCVRADVGARGARAYILGLCVCCDWDWTDEALVYLSGPVWGPEEQACGSRWPYISITLDGHHSGQLFILISLCIGCPKRVSTALLKVKSTANQSNTDGVTLVFFLFILCACVPMCVSVCLPVHILAGSILANKLR